MLRAGVCPSGCWEDVARVGLASYKVGRLVAKERVTKFVRAPVTQDEEATEPEPTGGVCLGELVTCPHRVGLWTAALGSRTGSCSSRGRRAS